MSNGEYALDVLDELRASIDDYTALRKAVRGRTRRGRSVDVDHATKALTACLRDLLQSCWVLADGNRKQRDMLAGQLAALSVETDTRSKAISG